MRRAAAGRANWPLIAPSAMPYGERSQVPRAMTRDDMDRVRRAVRRGGASRRRGRLRLARAALRARLPAVGFLSPLTNQRDDEYGGDAREPAALSARSVRARCARRGRRTGRCRCASRRTTGRPAATRRTTPSRSRARSRPPAPTSSTCRPGRRRARREPVYGRMYQTPFADRIRNEVGIATIAVGNIFEADHVNSIIAAGRADLCALGAAAPRRSGLDAARGGAAGHATARRGRSQYLAGKAQLERNLARAAARGRRAAGGERMSATAAPLAGRHAVVTGGGRGIGARDRAARSPPTARADAARAATARGSTPRRARCGPALSRAGRHADVADPAAVRCAFARHRAARGAASTSWSTTPAQAASAPFAETDDALWHEMLAVNLTGTFLLHACGAARDAAAQPRPHRQHREHRRADRLRLRHRLLRRQARRRRPHARAGARARDDAASPSTRSAPATPTPTSCAARCEHRREDRPQRGRGARRAGDAQSAGAAGAAGGGGRTPSLWLVPAEAQAVTGQALAGRRRRGDVHERHDTSRRSATLLDAADDARGRGVDDDHERCGCGCGCSPARTLIETRDPHAAAASEFGTTLPRFDLMAQLERAPDGLQDGRAVAALMVTGGNVTGITDQLERKAWSSARADAARPARAGWCGSPRAAGAAFAAMAVEHERWIVEFARRAVEPAEMRDRLRGAARAASRARCPRDSTETRDDASTTGRDDCAAPILRRLPRRRTSAGACVQPTARCATVDARTAPRRRTR